MKVIEENLLVKICNITADTIVIKHGEAIAQLLIIPCIKPMLETGFFGRTKQGG